MSRWDVLVTPKSIDVTSEEIARQFEDAGCSPFKVEGPLTSAQLGTAWRKADAAILGLDQADRPAIEAADRLQMISRYGVGYDNVDLVAASEKQIVVTTTPGTNDIAVAELTVALILALARNFGVTLASRPVLDDSVVGTELSGKVLGVVGLGKIGSGVATRLTGFGMTIVFSDQELRTFPKAASHGWKQMSLETLLSVSDIVTLHCPLNSSTYRLFGGERFAMMKKGALLVNTARGDLIEEEALADALTSGHVRGSALDVRAVASAAKRDALAGVPGVLFSPHAGSRTVESYARMRARAIANLIAAKTGTGDLLGIVNPVTSA